MEWEWTPEKVGELRRLWDEGVPSAEIGRRLGITKNAVIGKVHRLGFPHRGSPIKKPPAPPAPVVLELKGPACSWPIGHPREPGFHFCGAPALSGKPYCPDHVAVAYLPSKTRERAA